MSSPLHLTPPEIDALRTLASSIKTSPSARPNAYCQQTRSLSLRLPLRIRSALQNFAAHGSPSGHLLFKTAPPTSLPPTPPDNSSHTGETTSLANIQAIFLQSISEMVAYEAEGAGRLFQDIVPNRKMAHHQTSLGSQTELEIHTEQAFSAVRPDFLSLACLRGDPRAVTYILPVQTLIANLTPEEQSLLREPLWTTGVDLSFKLHGKEFIDGDVRGPMPILYHFSGGRSVGGVNCDDVGDSGHSTDAAADTLLRFDQDLMRGITDPAQQMIKKVVDIYYAHRIGHVLSPGEIMVIDNRRAVHGRSPFHPRYDGHDRFLARSFSVLDYDKTAYARPDGGRVVTAIYS